MTCRHCNVAIRQASSCVADPWYLHISPVGMSEYVYCNPFPVNSRAEPALDREVARLPLPLSDAQREAILCLYCIVADVPHPVNDRAKALEIVRDLIA